MAYIQQPIDEEEKKRLAAQGAPTDIVSQPGAPVSGGAIGSGEAPQGPAPAGATRQFADVRSFLEANRPQAQQLAQRIGGEIQKESETVQKDIGSAGQQFQQEVEKGAVRTEPARGLISQAVKTPEQIAADKAKVAELSKIRTAQYQGPQSLKGTEQYAGLESRVGEAERKAGLTETEAGRSELLGLTGRPSTGGLRLDQLLLSQTPEARAALQAAAAGTTGLRGTLGQTAQAGEEAAKQAAAETEQTRALFGEEFGKAKTSFQKQLEDRLAQVTSQAKARAEAAKGSLTGGMDAQALADLGITQEDLGRIQQAQKDLQADYGFQRDISEYLSQEAPNFNVSQIASEADLAKQKALEELAGQQFGILGSKVGGASTDLSNFATEAARQGTTQTLSAFDRALIDKYYNREGLGEQEKAIQNALKREAEYAKGKTWAALPPEEPKKPPLLDQITDAGTMREYTEGLTKPIIGQTGSDLLGTAVGAAVLPTQITKDIAKYVAANPVKAATLPISAQVEVVKALVENPKQAVSNVVNKVSKSIKKAFCFVAESFFVMADNSTRAVEDIQLGDTMKDGGVVISVRRSYVDENVFDYKGTHVTGSHAVFEDGLWIRVGDSKHSVPLAHRGIVYSVVNEKHRMVSNLGVLFADEMETDDYEDLTIEQSLKKLNNGAVPVEVV